MIKGDLKSVSLVTLVQLISQEGKSGALFLSRGRERGVIFLDEGELIHAMVGELVGAKAFYRLLDWDEGTFRMSEHVEMPQRTIESPLNHLLLEGLRRIDETREKGQEQSKPLTQADIAQDKAFENDLILLLSNLEYARAKLADRKHRRRPALALRALAEMTNEVVAFSESRLNSQAKTNSLVTALDRAGEVYPRARLLQPEQNRLSPQTVQNLYSSWKGNSSGRHQTFNQIALGIVDVLETHFSLLIDHFNASSKADQWGETSDVFVKDLKQAIKRVKF
jgi:hypothetical protein